MHPNEIRTLMSGDTLADKRWPPESEVERLERVRDHRRRYVNAAPDLFRYRADLHVEGDPAATHDRMNSFTPAGLPRTIARFSAQLLFSEQPKLKVKAAEPDIGLSPEQATLEDIVRENDLPARLYAGAEEVAATGSGALRIILDDDVSSLPIIAFEPSDRVMWATAYDRVVGGVVVVEKKHDGAVYRLLEEHGVTPSGAGYVRRRLFKGSETRLGASVGLGTGPPEFRDLRDEYRTGISRPTLVRWLNVPSGVADVAGQEAALDALDEAESLGLRKARASEPRIFVHRRLVDDRGAANLSGAILLDDSLNPVETPSELVRTEQASMQSGDHIAYCEHLKEGIVTGCGYSLASWGLDKEGRADSGTALKLRQSTTLRTRAGKAHLAVGAIAEMLSSALELSGEGRVEVDVQLSDGMPTDSRELSEELATLKDAALISDEEAVRRLHPDWTEDQVAAEVGRLSLVDGRSELDRILSGNSLGGGFAG